MFEPGLHGAEHLRPALAIAVGALQPALVSRQPSSAIVTSVRPSSSGSKVMVTVVSYFAGVSAPRRPHRRPIEARSFRRSPPRSPRPERRRENRANPTDGGAGFEPALGAAGGEIVRQLAPGRPPPRKPPMTGLAMRPATLNFSSMAFPPLLVLGSLCYKNITCQAMTKTIEFSRPWPRPAGAPCSIC